MYLLLKNSIRWASLFGPALFLFSCASYNRQATTYYTNLVSGNYQKASDALDHNKLLNKKRNRLLYLLEKGKMLHLSGKYGESNRCFNEADLLMEDARITVKDVALGTLLNPMMEGYKGEDFEKYMVHYYKALNYLQLSQPEEALVEAKRISLRSYAQEDKNGSKNLYTSDAFSFMLQGLIYEKNKDINNAFIAYRNAADIYLNNGGNYYGVEMPQQLKKDLLRTAYLNGFTQELERYEQLCHQQYKKEEAFDGEVILFWENGLAPVKGEQNLFFTLTDAGGGNFVFVDGTGLFQIPFDFGSGFNDRAKLSSLKTFRIAIPRYMQQPEYFQQAVLSLNAVSYQLEEAQSINDLAFATLKERMIKDLSKTLTRLAIKKLAEAAAKPAEDEKDKDKKARKEALSLGIQVFSLASEKADTRNWQSLPHTISYVRMPLQKGSNHLALELSSSKGGKKTELTIENRGGMHFYNFCSIRL